MPAIDVPEDGPGLLIWIQGWFTSMCDGDWEHGRGVTVETLDNPGWMLRVELVGTGLEDRTFDRLETQRDEHDWVHAWIADGLFEVACGPMNLSEALWIFREWATA